MSIHSVDKTTGDITLLSGGTLWSDMPVGSIIPYGGTTAPEGALLCDGAEYLRADYPELFAVIGTSFGTPSENTKFKVPDLRETVPVGVGTSTRSDIATHDAYNVGEFKDDQFQDHAHKTHLKGLQYSEGSLWATAYDQDTDGTTTTGAVSGRVGTTTHGKQLGVTYVIKAKQTALPVDFQEGLEAIIGTLDVTDSAVEGSYVTAVSETDGKVSVTREAADAVPTESSNKMVKSGGIYEAEQNEAKTRAKLGAHNFVALNRSTYKPQYEANLSSVTDQTEDSVTVTSIAADYAGLRLYNKIAPGEYIVSYDFESDDTSYVPAISLYYSNSDLIPNGGNILKNTQRKITVLDSYDYVEIRLFITRASDAVIRTGTFRNLMFRLATDTDDTYQAFTKTNKQLTDDKAEQTEVNDMNNILGAKNVFSVGKDFSEWFLSSVNGTTPSDKAVSERITGTIEEKTSSVNITSYDNSGYFWPCKKINLEKNTEYKVTYGAVVNNAFIKIFGRTSGQSAGSTLRELTDNLTFDSGNYDEWWVGIYPVNNGVYTSFEQMMIRPASVKDETFETYAKTNQELTKDVQPIPTMINDLGAKNVMPFILSDIKTYNNGGTWNGNSYTMNGVTFTLDLDEKGSLKDVVVDGTATAKSFFTLTNWADKTEFIGKILNGCTEGSTTTFAIITTYRDSNNQYVTDRYQVDNDYVVEDVSGSALLKFMIFVMNGMTISNKKFYPMLRDASIADDTYTPYAKTNKELTNDLAGLTLALIEGDAPSTANVYVTEDMRIALGLSSSPSWFVILSAEFFNSTNNIWYQASNDPFSTTSYVAKASADGGRDFRVMVSNTAYTKYRAIVAYKP